LEIQRKLIVAVDFDSTIFKSAGVEFPSVGAPVPGAVETLKHLKELGHTLVLWTCRGEQNDWLDPAISALTDNHLWFDYINEAPEQEHLSNKLHADVFIDDKGLGCPTIYYKTPCGHHAPYVDWEKVRQWLKDNYGIQISI
jgi:hypothetical protein